MGERTLRGAGEGRDPSPTRAITTRVARVVEFGEQFHSQESYAALARAPLGATCPPPGPMGPDRENRTRCPDGQPCRSHFTQQGSPPVAIVHVIEPIVLRVIDGRGIRVSELPRETARGTLVPRLDISGRAFDPGVHSWVVGDVG